MVTELDREVTELLDPVVTELLDQKNNSDQVESSSIDSVHILAHI
jgi:hypothetical protein